MITPEMYDNAQIEIERLRAHVEWVEGERDGMRELLFRERAELARLQSELDGWRAAKTWADVPEDKP